MKKRGLPNNFEGKLNGELENYKIFEEGTNVKLQFEYERISKLVLQKSKLVFNVDEDIEKLFAVETGTKSKRELLVRLSFSDEVKAYRALEKFAEKKDKVLNDWATLALQRNRAVIESSLSSNNTVFIATGLGGSGRLLRYFFVVFSKGKKNFSFLQKDIIKNEVTHSIEMNKGICEELEIQDTFATCLCLVPLNISPDKVLKAVIENSNLFGNFLDEKIIATNTKKYSLEEIIDLAKPKPKRKLGSIDDFDF
jgi:hypothetical protein